LRAALVNAFGPRQRIADTPWQWLVVGLLLATVALTALLFLVADSNSHMQSELVVTAFVGVLGGLLGPLIGGPWRQPAR
jgi:hypothetical protein